MCDANGELLAHQGDIERPYFMRSVAKPFQAAVAQRLGAALPPEWLAVASASHGGSPAHIAIVEAMLHDAGLTTRALRCPPAWPLAEPATLRLIRAGQSRPQSVWHNCSGKHAAMLRACAAQGWDVAHYTDPQHPLQEAIRAELAQVLGQTPAGPGVDGCGAPVWAVSTAAVAVGYARLGSQPALRETWTAMHRFAALTADHGASPVALARWTETSAKLGAEGLLGISTRRGIGVCIKSWDGARRALGPVAGAVMAHLGLRAPGTSDRLQTELESMVLGGGIPVGHIEATVGLA